MPRLKSVVALALLLAACGGSSSGGNGNGDGDGGGGDGGDGDGGTGACQTAADCAGGVCDPDTSTCVTDLACTTHAECGDGAHCASDGMCTPSTTGSPCETEVQCTGSDICIGGFCGCSGTAVGAASVPPNVLIVLDRSGSMNQSAGAGGSKWEVALAAIEQLTTTYGDQIRFGLALYPGTNVSCSQGMDCGPGATFVDPASGTTPMINTTLGNANTCSFGTPTAEMLASLVDYPGLEDAARPNYVLLITDGQSTCDDPIPQATALLGQTPSVKTFVVGFGDGVDPAELNALATAGDTAIVGGPPSYYEADDPTSLGNALTAIAGSVLTCSYVLDVATDPADLFVYVDSVLVERDTGHASGWDYDPASTTVTFYGGTCDALRAGTASAVAIVAGCPIVVD